MKYAKGILALVVLVALAIGIYFYWQHQARYPSTDDAYVQANIITIAPEITGRVTAVNVVENQLVAAGDVLFTLDDTVFANAVQQAEQQVQSLQKTGEALAQQVVAATAQVTSATAAKQVADEQAARTQTLLGQGNASQVQGDDDTAAAVQAAAALDSAQSGLAQANADVIANQDDVVAAQAQLNTAQLALDHATVKAPVAGWIANLTLRPGSVVAAYQPQFALVDAGDWWVDANFAETDLPRIVAGLPVSIEVDMLPGVTLTGKVASLGIGSGSSFSLLPAQNASSNWVKVTQRFAVRVTLDEPVQGLRVGASANATVDTTAAPVAP
ncbi:membrane fusion protein, multidrug efflux system [Devosia sp. YR412]|uniref:HlyD family secretion protein n=1 Tax=Devosia sp. YR412 TaxID=1881030 RepID=UPI0008C25513|nr:HlyD family secretion protein [Devosia sp. YR412]SEP77113.1 membrane fusion protein, multidrug efflux system [Devosia sp. YR412]